MVTAARLPACLHLGWACVPEPPAVLRARPSWRAVHPWMYTLSGPEGTVFSGETCAAPGQPRHTSCVPLFTHQAPALPGPGLDVGEPDYSCEAVSPGAWTSGLHRTLTLPSCVASDILPPLSEPGFSHL